MIKNIVLILVTFSFITVQAQDTLGTKFEFGYEMGKVYTYKVISQDIVRNVNFAPLSIETDTFNAEIKVESKTKEGYGVVINFKPNRKGAELPDLFYKVPLKIVLDSNGNALAMVNHNEYQVLLFDEITRLLSEGVYDSLTAYKMAYQYKTKKSIENLIYTNLADFFTLFGRQFQTKVIYAVGKEIYHPFGPQPFIAAGTTKLKELKNKDITLEIKTEIGNTEEERPLLTKIYEDYTRSIGQYNPNQTEIGVDLGYETIFNYNTITKQITFFYVENAIRVENESKVSSFQMKLIN